VSALAKSSAPLVRRIGTYLNFTSYALYSPLQAKFFPEGKLKPLPSKSAGTWKVHENVAWVGRF
jgi:hypothetical protein